MKRTRKAWLTRLEDRTLTLGDLDDLFEDWGEETQRLEAKIDDLEETPEPETVEVEVHVANWGNCRRGCLPAYLNEAGYCSPNCERGWPRGEFVAAPALLTNTSSDPDVVSTTTRVTTIRARRK